MEQSRITNTTIIALILGLIIGFAGGAYWYKGKMAGWSDTKTGDIVTDTKEDIEPVVMEKDTKDSSMVSGPITTITSTVLDTNTISAPNQKAGDTVLVSKVVSDAVVWVAVREDNGGLMGNILGARKVSVGMTENVVVELLRPTVIGGKYYVILFRDNGDGAFDHKTDAPIASDGSIIVSTFNAQ